MRTEYSDFALNSKPDKNNNHKEREGKLENAKTYYILSGLNYNEAEKEFELDSGYIVSGSLTDNMVFQWDQVKEGSASSSETEWYYPSFTATISTVGGVYTKDNIDQKYPVNHSKSMLLWIILAKFPYAGNRG